MHVTNTLLDLGVQVIDLLVTFFFRIDVYVWLDLMSIFHRCVWGIIRIQQFYYFVARDHVAKRKFGVLVPSSDTALRNLRSTLEEIAWVDLQLGCEVELIYEVLISFNDSADDLLFELVNPIPIFFQHRVEANVAEHQKSDFDSGGFEPIKFCCETPESIRHWIISYFLKPV
jgi:hypothetical protein